MAAGDITYGVSDDSSAVATDIAAAVTVTGSANEKIIIQQKGCSWIWWHIEGA